jgi:hypothetical protein
MTTAQLKRTLRDFRHSRNDASGRGLAVYTEVSPVGVEVVEALIAEIDALNERMKSLEERILDLQYRSPGPI